MKVITPTEEGHRPIKIWTDDVDDNALQQLLNLATLPFIHKHGVVAMPDVHWGIGATVGSVIATKSAVIPAAVGVDIGCGMNAVKTNLTALDLPDSLSDLRHSIERGIPLGAGGKRHEKETVGLFEFLPSGAKYNNGWDAICDIVGDVGKTAIKAASQLGTLGSGNHFIEICLDESNNVWIMLHSGSRGLGNIVGRAFIELAKEDMRKYYINLPDTNLAYFPEGTEHYNDYIDAVEWLQVYAYNNRTMMLNVVLRALMYYFKDKKDVHVIDEAINCHHNYVTKENHFGENLWITRKGAIRAREGDLGIIPGSMGQRSYIVRGKGNRDSYCSCSHGAGRKYGRKEAIKRFTVDDLIKQTEGVECRKDAAVLDEIPAAYKDIDQIMANQTDLVEPIHVLKQILCIKGN